MKTAIDFLIMELDTLEAQNGTASQKQDIIRRMKEIEKTQIMNAYIAGDLNGLISMVDNQEVLTPEEYYNKLYK